MKDKLLILLILVFSFSCSDLELKPLDRITEEAVFSSAEEFDAAIFASYSSFQKLYQNRQVDPNQNFAAWLKLTLFPSDAVVWGSFEDQPGMVRGAQELDTHSFDASIQPLQAAYSYIYEGIARANIVLSKLDEKGATVLTNEEITRMRAEAKFLRAFLHFQAMKVWGTPPLVTERITDPNNAAKGNSTKEELSAQILSDFADASEGLPEVWDDANTGRATKWAAQAFIGKVNVWIEDWNSAIAAFERVEASQMYSLGTDGDSYDPIFAEDNENNNATIFEIQFGSSTGGNIWVLEDEGVSGVAAEGNSRGYYQGLPRDVPPGRNLTDPNGTVASIQSIGLYEVAPEFVSLFEAGDIRRNNFIYEDGDVYDNLDGVQFIYEANHPEYDYSGTGYHIEKYNDITALTIDGPDSRGRFIFNNERFFRYAEMVLLYAEALIESGREDDGLQQVNRIRARAGLPAATADATAAMRLEKRIELAFEGQRTFDMMRWGIGGIFKVFPFPQAEISKSGGLLKQNTP